MASKWFHSAKFFFLACALFDKVRFLKLAIFFQQKFWQVWFRFFRQVYFFWQSSLLAKSVFSKGFGKSSALAFWQVNLIFQNKVGLVKNDVACKIKSQKAWFLFLGKGSCITRSHLTKRAPDAGDSAHIPSIFTRLSLFPVGRLRRPRPSAGILYEDDGANR